MVVGENGILKKAGEASEKTKIATEDEQRKMAMYEATMNTELTYFQDVPIPAGFAPTRMHGESTVDEGLVIVDSKGNSYVWIEVPKSIYNDKTYKEGITDETIGVESCENIEKVLQNYVKEYRREKCSDVWHQGCGINSKEEYDELKNKMLKSVYENGGFWVGQFEVGYEGDKIRFYDGLTSDLILTDEMPVIKENAYPYNWVKCSQAQALASNMSVGQYNSSLMFGIQWDLMLKFLEVQNANTKDELMNDSGSWGNYKGANFIVKQGKYSENKSQIFTDVSGSYQKKSISEVLLTTGATKRNSALNIYDVAGNLWEFTLENITTFETNGNCSRGGGYDREGTNKEENGSFDCSASGQNNYSPSSSSHYAGFRTTLF